MRWFWNWKGWNAAPSSFKQKSKRKTKSPLSKRPARNNFSLWYLHDSLSAFSSPVFAGEWKAKIAKELNALVTSCVVVPCSFTHPHGNLPTSRLRGTWHLSKNSTERIYDEDNSNVMESYKERTQLLGLLGQNNCTLEIVDVKDYDNGPFCFQIEIVQTQTDTSPEKHSFDNNCVRLKMLRMSQTFQNFSKLYTNFLCYNGCFMNDFFFFLK